jgi:cyclopropane fatty-acyl-phospholipid synthase-like methyltransferase
MDYSSLAREEQFDKIVSIGMIEHAGKRTLRSLCVAWRRNSGRAG